MRVLSIDSSTASAACAVIEDGKLLGEVVLNDKKQHSVILMPIIDSLLNNLKLDVKDVDAFIVSSGPGSFTGLRIGMATAKGLAQANDKPFIGISTLDALAFNLAYTSGIICPILDALRDNVYTALYSFNNGILERISDYMAIHIDELVSLIKEKTPSAITFIGDAVPKFSEKLEKNFDTVYFAPAHLNLARASSLGELGLIRLSDGHQDNLLTFSPIYIRKSQAEREYESKTGVSINE